MCLPCCWCLPPPRYSLFLFFLFLFYLYLTPFLSPKTLQYKVILNCSAGGLPTPLYPDRDTPTYSLGSEPLVQRKPGCSSLSTVGSSFNS